jgi:hypothetical protein
VEHIVLNEVYANTLKNIVKLVQRLRGSGKCVYADGDPRQITPPLDATNPFVKRIGYMDRMLTPVLPKRMVLEGSRRLLVPGDVTKLVAIRDDLDAGLCIRSVVSKHGLRVCASMEEVTAIGRGVAATNLTCARVSNMIGEAEATHVIAKKFSRNLVTNHRYEVLDRSDSSYKVLCKDGKERFMGRDFFRKPHILTVDSKQGSTWDAPYVILDAERMTADRLWVAMTSCRRMDQVHFYFGRLSEVSPHALAAQKIERYRESDATRGWKCDLDVPWWMQQAKRQNYACYLCKQGIQMEWETDDPMQASVDRLDSTRGHVQANCKLSCLRCNVSKKDAPL